MRRWLLELFRALCCYWGWHRPVALARRRATLFRTLYRVQLKQCADCGACWECVDEWD